MDNFLDNFCSQKHSSGHVIDRCFLFTLVRNFYLCIGLISKENRFFQEVSRLIVRAWLFSTVGISWQCACYRSLPTRCVQWWTRSAKTARARHRASEYSGSFPDKYDGIARRRWPVVAYSIDTSVRSRILVAAPGVARSCYSDRLPRRFSFVLTQVSPREGTAATTAGEEAGEETRIVRARTYERSSPRPALPATQIDNAAVVAINLAIIESRRARSRRSASRRVASRVRIRPSRGASSSRRSSGHVVGGRKHRAYVNTDVHTHTVRVASVCTCVARRWDAHTRAHTPFFISGESRRPRSWFPTRGFSRELQVRRSVCADGRGGRRSPTRCWRKHECAREKLAPFHGARGASERG